MTINWSRRALLASVGAASLAGCLGILEPTGERSADDLPDDCPTSTLADYDPPDDFSRGAIETFVIEYHEAYVLNEMFSPTHERDSVSGNVTSIDRHENGYVVLVEWGGSNYSDLTESKAEPATDPPDSDLPSVETLDSKILRESATEAGEQDETVWDGTWEGNGPDWDLDQIREDLESLPRNKDDPSDPNDLVGYVRVDDAPVRLHLRLIPSERDGGYMHMSTRYYVDSHVVRQSDNHWSTDEDTDPPQFSLLECQS